MSHTLLGFSRITFLESAVLDHLTYKCNKINKHTYRSLHPRMRQEQTTGHRLPQASSRNDHSDRAQVLMYPYQGELTPSHNNKGIAQKLASFVITQMTLASILAQKL